jgi:hypothetical protein
MMTLKIQEPNILDKILGLLRKKRGLVLPEKNSYQKWGAYTTYVIPRENFFRALFRSNKHAQKNILYDIKEVEEKFDVVNKSE